MSQDGRRIVEVTGNGSGFSSVEVFSRKNSGVCTGVDIRLDTTDSNASAIIPWGVCLGDDLADAPAQDVIVFSGTSIVLTADDRVASLSTRFDNPPDFYDGFRVGGNVTATGAYKLFITVHYRIRDR